MLPPPVRDGNDPGGRRTLIKTDGDRADNNLGAGNWFDTQRLRRGRLDDHGREFDRFFRLRQNQLALSCQCSPGRQVVGLQPVGAATSFTVTPGRKLSDTMPALISSGH